MHRLVALLIPCLMAGSISPAMAQPLRNQQPRYPRVYGPTGSTYGPTQAHYQYQKQYHRPWHGYGGEPYHSHQGYHSHGIVSGYPSYGINYGIYPIAPFSGYPSYDCPYGYRDYGIATFSAYYPYPYASGYANPWNPAFGNPQLMGEANPFDNPVLNQAQQEEWDRWQNPVQPLEQIDPLPPLPPQSSPETRLKSLRYQDQGDHWFLKQNYVNAYSRYRSAQEVAPDLPEPYFRKAYALVALGHYEKAAEEFRRGLRIQPEWPSMGYSLGQLLGPDNELARSVIHTRLIEWVKLDIRDPERLFVAGVVLHFDRPDQARVLFETAYRLAGGGEYLAMFLQPIQPEFQENPNNQPTPVFPAQPQFPQQNPPVQNQNPQLQPLPDLQNNLPGDPRDLPLPEPAEPEESVPVLPPPLPAPPEFKPGNEHSQNGPVFPSRP